MKRKNCESYSFSTSATSSTQPFFSQTNKSGMFIENNLIGYFLIWHSKRCSCHKLACVQWKIMRQTKNIKCARLLSHNFVRQISQQNFAWQMRNKLTKLLYKQKSSAVYFKCALGLNSSKTFLQQCCPKFYGSYLCTVSWFRDDLDMFRLSSFPVLCDIFIPCSSNECWFLPHCLTPVILVLWCSTLFCFSKGWPSSDGSFGFPSGCIWRDLSLKSTCLVGVDFSLLVSPSFIKSVVESLTYIWNRMNWWTN